MKFLKWLAQGTHIPAFVLDADDVDYSRFDGWIFPMKFSENTFDFICGQKGGGNLILVDSSDEPPYFKSFDNLDAAARVYLEVRERIKKARSDSNVD